MSPAPQLQAAVFTVLAAFALTSCQKDFTSAATLQEVHEHDDHHHEPGGRPGLHGMALFGDGPYYLAHIPMLSAPHDEQLLLQATLMASDGTLLESDYSAQGFSVRPAGVFPLDDLASGALDSFSGNIHVGNFEHGGALETAAVTFQIDTVMVSRKLPTSATTPAGEQHGFLFGTTEDTYIVNQITPQRSYQQIVKAQLDTLPEGFAADAVLEVIIDADERLAADTLPLTGNLKNDQEGDQAFTIEGLNELWCLQGPDFFTVCD